MVEGCILQDLIFHELRILLILYTYCSHDLNFLICNLNAVAIVDCKCQIYEVLVLFILLLCHIEEYILLGWHTKMSGVLIFVQSQVLSFIDMVNMFSSSIHIKNNFFVVPLFSLA